LQSPGIQPHTKSSLRFLPVSAIIGVVIGLALQDTEIFAGLAIQMTSLSNRRRYYNPDKRYGRG